MARGETDARASMRVLSAAILVDSDCRPAVAGTKHSILCISLPAVVSILVL